MRTYYFMIIRYNNARSIKVYETRAEMDRDMNKFEGTDFEVVGFLSRRCYPSNLGAVSHSLYNDYCVNRPEPVYIKSYDLKSLCQKKNWFTCGSNYQYDKLFELADTGDIDRVATLIWGCSDEQAGTVDHIKLELMKAAM